MSLLLLFWGSVTECTSRSYLQGFVDSVVPLAGTPQQKVEAIMAWMRNPPVRLPSPLSAAAESYRDPVRNLSYTELLEDCGTSASVLIAAADRLGMKPRRRLLLDEQWGADCVCRRR